MTVALWPPSRPAGPVTLRAAIIAVCALLSTGAAVIHFAVLGEHWREWWGYGLFFGVAAWLQLAWAAIVIARPSLRLLLGGAIANFAIAALWLVTRTGGIPIGPAAGETESATLIDAIATAFEVALGLGVFVAAAVHSERLTFRRWLAAAAILAVAVAVVVLTTIGLVDASSPGGGHSGEHAGGTDHDH